MKKRMLVGLLVALLAGFGAAVVLASPGEDQYGNVVTQESAPGVTTQGIEGTTTAETVTVATTTAETTTAGTTTGETTTTTTPSSSSGPNTPSNTPSALGEAPASDGSQLPFTGIELGLIVAGGLAAAGAGLVLRRVSRSRRS